MCRQFWPTKSLNYYYVQFSQTAIICTTTNLKQEISRWVLFAIVWAVMILRTIRLEKLSVYYGHIDEARLRPTFPTSPQRFSDRWLTSFWLWVRTKSSHKLHKKPAPKSGRATRCLPLTWPPHELTTTAGGPKAVQQILMIKLTKLGPLLQIN